MAFFFCLFFFFKCVPVGGWGRGVCVEGSGARRVFLPCCEAHTLTRVRAHTHTHLDTKKHKHTSCFCKDTDRESLVEEASVVHVCRGRGVGCVCERVSLRAFIRARKCARTPSDKHIVRTAAGWERIRPRSALNSRRRSLEESNVPTFSSARAPFLTCTLLDLPRRG